MDSDVVEAVGFVIVAEVGLVVRDAVVGAAALEVAVVGPRVLVVVVGLTGLWAVDGRLVVGFFSVDDGVIVDLRSEVVFAGALEETELVREALFTVAEMPCLLFSSPELAMDFPLSSAELPKDARGLWVVVVVDAGLRVVVVDVTGGRVGGRLRVLPVVPLAVAEASLEATVAVEPAGRFVAVVVAVAVPGRLGAAIVPGFWRGDTMVVVFSLAGAGLEGICSAGSSAGCSFSSVGAEVATVSSTEDSGKEGSAAGIKASSVDAMLCVVVCSCV